MPVMGIDTLRFIMVLHERTPFSLEVVHVEIRISRHLMQKSRFDIIDRVSKGAELFVFALARLLSAKSGLVLFRMVKSFDTIMCKLAIVFVIALFSFSVFANISRIHFVFPPPIYAAMVIRAVLMVVLALNVAFFSFEKAQV